MLLKACILIGGYCLSSSTLPNVNYQDMINHDVPKYSDIQNTQPVGQYWLIQPHDRVQFGAGITLYF